MKWSRYSRLWKSKRSGWLLYNAASGSFEEVPEETAAKLLEIAKDPEAYDFSSDPGLYLDLRYGGHLVSDTADDDYFSVRKLRFLEGAFSRRGLTLTVAITRSCNFACSYCYEKDRRGAVMSEEIAQKLLKFIDLYKKEDDLYLVWYGGEPLLGIDRIREISAELEKRGRKFGAGLVTNGYLLTDDIIADLDRLRIGLMQITLDGGRETHNGRRYLVDGGPTYDVILENLDHVMKSGYKGKIHIRCNIDTRNSSDFAKVYRSLHEKYPEDFRSGRILVYPGIVKGEGHPDASCFFDPDAMAQFAEESLRRDGIQPLSVFPRRASYGCTLNCRNSYVVGPEGELYKCWDFIGMKDRIIGSIDGKTPWDAGQIARGIVGCSYFDSPECRECFYFPMCDGGCQKIRLLNLEDGGDRNCCSYFKGHLEDLLELHYEWKKLTTSSKKGKNTMEYMGKEATKCTAQKNAGWYQQLDFSDNREKENALRSLMEAPRSLRICNDKGDVVWDVADYSFVQEMETAPDTINPSLWRNTLYNSYAGLFEVCDGIYQVRGYDMANATFIRTDHGWIVFDVLMCEEDMAAAKALMEKHFGPLHVIAVLYSHPHIDHFGGIFGLITRADAADASLSLEEQLASGRVAILAPKDFLKYAVSENIYAGTAMARRAQYQYGTTIKIQPKGKMAIGIGLGQSVGRVGLLAPTYEVASNETLVIDGVEIRFQLTPGTEAPVEMNAYFPKYRALWLAENCTGTMHNLYTLRGAQVRSADAWAAYILEAEQMFADGTDVVFQSHNWPHWKTAEIREYMENTAAVYQFIHDQTLHYINLGYTAAEISNTLELPESLNRVWYMRQYYGTLSHNIKAVYQKYMGWYDANPVNLNPMSPADSAKKLVEYFGDVEPVIEKAKADFEKGEYQWVAQIMMQLVFADPSNQEARDLCADALEQLGYQSESGPWRNVYLTGAMELRIGNQACHAMVVSGNENMYGGMTGDMILGFIGIGTDAKAAEKDDLSLNLCLTDSGEKYFVKRRSGVLLSYRNRTDASADCSITCPKQILLGILLGKKEAMQYAKIEGDATVPARFVRYITMFTPDFNIIEP